jgi:hypothetical protein
MTAHLILRDLITLMMLGQSSAAASLLGPDIGMTAHLILLHLITLIIHGQFSATASQLGPDIYLNALISNIFHLCSSVSARAHVSCLCLKQVK